MPEVGNEAIVTIFIAQAVPQLLLTEYDTGSVPALIPVTRPVPLTVALPLPALHVPPAVRSVSVIEVPVHRLSGPVIMPASGNGLIVIAALVLTLPQLLLIV
jgi:hypothetical protein